MLFMSTKGDEHMSFRNTVKAMMSGMWFPGFFLPIAYSCMYYFHQEALQANPIQFAPLWIPVAFGVMNIFASACCKGCQACQCASRMWFAGILLGLAVAHVGIQYLNIPGVVLHLEGNYQYAPYVVLPIIYGIIFRYIVNWSNRIINI